MIPESIKCPACDATMTDKPTLSFLGFIASRCPACSLKFNQPLPIFFRVTYVVLGVLVVVSSIVNGLNVVSLLYLAAIAAALTFDIQAVRRLAKQANNRMQRTRER
jgi:hypothetical protein